MTPRKCGLRDAPLFFWVLSRREEEAGDKQTHVRA